MDLQKVLEFRNSRNRFCHRLGIVITELSPGYAKVVKTVEEEDLNPGNIAHGGLLRTGEADLILNDQRRAFSDEYVNLLLTTCHSYIEVSAHSPLARMERISPPELKNIPCILVASETQRETEQEYYHDVVGFHGGFLYAGNLEEARLMVIGRKGFLPVEGTGQAAPAGTSMVRIPLVRGGEPILRNYCAFWKKSNSGCYVEEFAGLLKAQFEK